MCIHHTMEFSVASDHWQVAPALATGCTMVLKPSKEAPLNAFMLADILDEIRLPAGVFNLVSGHGSSWRIHVITPRCRYGLFHRIHRCRCTRQPSCSSNGQASHLGIGRQERQCRTGRCRPSTGWQDGNWGMLPELRSNLFGSDTIDHSKINE